MKDKTKKKERKKKLEKKGRIYCLNFDAKNMLVSSRNSGSAIRAFSPPHVQMRALPAFGLGLLTETNGLFVGLKTRTLSLPRHCSKSL